MLTVILEGCDCAGKTTRLLQLLKAFKTVTYIHATKDTTIQQYLEAVDTPAEVLLMDRFWLSEDIYGPIVRGTEPMAEPDVEMLNAALKLRGPVMLLYINAAYDVILDRFQKRGDDYITEDRLKDIWQAYVDKLHGKPFYAGTIPIIEVRTDLTDIPVTPPVPDEPVTDPEEPETDPDAGT